MQPQIHIPLLELKDNRNAVPKSGEQTTKTALIRKSRKTRFSHLSVHDVKTALFFIRESWKSGMASTLLTMPFALNAGYSSGCNANVGLTTAFIASFSNGIFSGSNHSFYVANQIAIPFLYAIQEQYGVEALPWVTLIIGLQIYVAYLLRWHHLIEFLPGFVREGYFIGLGIVVFNKYIDYCFGLVDLQANRAFTVYEDSVDMYLNYFKRGNLYYLIASFSVYLFLYFGNKIYKPFPWVLISSCFGIFYAIFYPSEKCLRSVYGSTTLSFSLLNIDGPKFALDFKTVNDLFQQSIPLSIYILIQNLICAKGAETLTGVKCDLDQETQCVSIANIASGLLGGLPCNAQQRLYVLNVQVRETNQWSQLINALSVYLFYSLFGIYFLEIPLFIVGGQLLYSAYQCPTWSYVDRVIENRRYLTIFKCTLVALLVIYCGAIQSVLIGSFYSLLKFAETMSAAASEIVLHTQKNQTLIQNLMQRELDGDEEIRQNENNISDILEIEDNYLLYRFNGSINYINVKNHVDQIKRLPEIDIIAFSFRYVSVFDEQALDRLCVVLENLIKCGREIYLTGLHPQMIEEMRYNKFFREFIEYCPTKLRYLNPQ